MTLELEIVQEYEYFGVEDNIFRRAKKFYHFVAWVLFL